MESGASIVGCLDTDGEERAGADPEGRARNEGGQRGDMGLDDGG